MGTGSGTGTGFGVGAGVGTGSGFGSRTTGGGVGIGSGFGVGFGITGVVPAASFVFLNIPRIKSKMALNGFFIVFNFGLLLLNILLVPTPRLA